MDGSPIIVRHNNNMGVQKKKIARLPDSVFDKIKNSTTPKFTP